jgi:hypothetical protein
MIGAAVILFALDPARTSVLPSCPFHTLTGWWCPGCGATRALHELLHGHWAAALRLNPLAIALLPLVGYLTVRREPLRVKPVWMWMLAGMILVFGIVRNIPVYPFTFLTP